MEVKRKKNKGKAAKRRLRWINAQMKLQKVAVNHSIRQAPGYVRICNRVSQGFKDFAKAAGNIRLPKYSPHAK